MKPRHRLPAPRRAQRDVAARRDGHSSLRRTSLRLPYWVGRVLPRDRRRGGLDGVGGAAPPVALADGAAHRRRERRHVGAIRHRISGREPGVTLLIVMAALKLLEMRTQREVTLSIYLGFFLVLTNFLFSQTIPLGLYMLVCVWIFIATMVGFNRIGSTPTLARAAAPGGGAAAAGAAADGGVLHPLSARHGPALGAAAGHALGALGALGDDDARATSPTSSSPTPSPSACSFDGDRPPFSKLYWRGPVMTEFDGTTWSVPADRAGREPRLLAAPDDDALQITLEPHNKTWLFALDVPAELPAGAYTLGDLEVRDRRPVAERKRYEMSSYLDYATANRLRRSC